MFWNWQQEDWPRFRYDKAELEVFETHFMKRSGLVIGLVRHIADDDKMTLIVDLLSVEALKTSEIEGEHLDRHSVQSSIRRNLGLETGDTRILSAESGIADMMVDLYRTYAKPLTDEMIFAWHRMLVEGRRDLKEIGRYRRLDEAMQVVSGPIHKPRIHFEAPPSALMPQEMSAFIEWFNRTAPDGLKPLPALTRAGLAHLYFVCIHPFEDGNGRIARALVEKSLSQSLGQPTLIVLSQTIEKDRKAYYAALERNNKDSDVTDWLIYFAKIVSIAQDRTESTIDFLIEKTKLYDRVKERLNLRQEKAVARLFRAGLDGFKGGLSAENYIGITKTSRATATRDLQDLVEKGILVRSGERKSTRYALNIRKL